MPASIKGENKQPHIPVGETIHDLAVPLAPPAALQASKPFTRSEGWL